MPRAGQILQVVPSPTLDNHLTRQEFTTMALHLGDDVANGNQTCSFCARPVDSKGRHCLCRVAGGGSAHHTIGKLFYMRPPTFGASSQSLRVEVDQLMFSAPPKPS